MTIAYRFGDRVDPWILVGVTVSGLIVLSYFVQRFVERPLALAMRRLLTNVEFGLNGPEPRRRR